MPSSKPRCIVIAGPNGAGKTTFAREFLPKDAGILHFVNADLIAAGLSPLDLPQRVGGPLVLLEGTRRTSHSASERPWMHGVASRWKAAGYQVEMSCSTTG